MNPVTPWRRENGDFDPGYVAAGQAICTALLGRPAKQFEHVPDDVATRWARNVLRDIAIEYVVIKDGRFGSHIFNPYGAHSVCCVRRWLDDGMLTIDEAVDYITHDPFSKSGKPELPDRIYRPSRALSNILDVSLLRCNGNVETIYDLARRNAPENEVLACERSMTAEAFVAYTDMVARDAGANVDSLAWYRGSAANLFFGLPADFDRPANPDVMNILCRAQHPPTMKRPSRFGPIRMSELTNDERAVIGQATQAVRDAHKKETEQ